MPHSRLNSEDGRERQLFKKKSKTGLISNFFCLVRNQQAPRNPDKKAFCLTVFWDVNISSWVEIFPRGQIDSTQWLITIKNHAVGNTASSVGKAQEVQSQGHGFINNAKFQ